MTTRTPLPPRSSQARGLGDMHHIPDRFGHSLRSRHGYEFRRFLIQHRRWRIRWSAVGGPTGSVGVTAASQTGQAGHFCTDSASPSIANRSAPSRLNRRTLQPVLECTGASNLASGAVRRRWRGDERHRSSSTPRGSSSTPVRRRPPRRHCSRRGHGGAGVGQVQPAPSRAAPAWRPPAC